MRNLVTADFTGRVYTSTPARRRCRHAGVSKNVNDIPDDVDVAIVVAVPAEAVTDVVLDCANKGVQWLIVIPASPRPARRAGAGSGTWPGCAVRTAWRPIGPNRLGAINTDPQAQVNASLSSVMPARGRAGFFCQSGALGLAILEKVRTGAWACRRSSARATGPTSGNDLPAVLGGGRRDRGRHDVPRVHRQPAQVLPIARRVSAAQADRGGPLGAPPRASRWAMPYDASAPRRRWWTRCSGQAGVIQVDTSTTCSTSPSCSPTSRSRAGAGSRSSATGRASACWQRTPPGGRPVVNRSVALGADATAEDFEDAPDDAIDDPRWTR